MATYLIDGEIGITRQEGDVADIVITVPDLLPMVGLTPRFAVFDLNGRAIVSKEEEIVVAGQVLVVPLLPADTQRRSGQHRWELEVTGTDGPVTIGSGPFAIVATRIK